MSVNARRRPASAAAPADPACTIRPACAGDDAALTALLHATFMETWAPEMSAEALARWQLREGPAAYVREKRADFVVAETDGALSGMIHWHEGFVHALHVDAGHRRQGIAAALMATAERDMRANGHREMRLETDTFNTGSRALYATLGFREVERYPDQQYDPRIVTLLLEKPLQ
jgi:ribosomal protein S18 acetylase RimI-like enzyme